MVPFPRHQVLGPWLGLRLRSLGKQLRSSARRASRIPVSVPCNPPVAQLSLPQQDSGRSAESRGNNLADISTAHDAACGTFADTTSLHNMYRHAPAVSCVHCLMWYLNLLSDKRRHITSRWTLQKHHR